MILSSPTKGDAPEPAYESMVDNTPETFALQRIFLEGNVVDQIARNSIFSDGVTIDTRDIGKAALETSATMVDVSVSRINQATFITPDGEPTILDSIVRSGEKWSHVEVKSGTDVKDKYVFDALVSTDRAMRAGLDVDTVSIVTVDGNWRLGDPDEALFRFTDITERIQDPDTIEFLKQTYDGLRQERPPMARLVPGCWGCGYFSNCFGDYQYPITLLKRLGKAKVSQLEDLGVYDIRNIPPEFELSDGQKETITSALDKEFRVDKLLLRGLLAPLEAPIRHLDFEWVSLAVPLHPDVAPWGAVTTQYSIHLETDDGLLHTEYLSDAEGDGRRRLAERMIADLGQGGSIVVYSIAAERSRIRDMARWFPDLENELLAIEMRLFDLQPLVKKCLSHPRFLGRSSLKLVPFIVPGFSYDGLEIDNGEDAMGVMNLMIRGEIGVGDVPLLRDQLLRYCERDTEATARILDALRSMAFN